MFNVTSDSKFEFYAKKYVRVNMGRDFNSHFFGRVTAGTKSNIYNKDINFTTSPLISLPW
jgi:hypothetical protein